jgi:hypothetical protein
LLALAAGLLLGTASAAQSWSVERALDFKPGTPQLRTKLKPQADRDLRALIADDFVYAMVDLDDDGHPEMVLTSAGRCPRLGCPVQVVTVKQGRLATLLSTALPGGLGVTREKQGGYRALVVLDDKGGIALADTPRPGLAAKLLVVPMAAAGASATTAAPAPAAEASPAPAARPTGRGPDVLGIVLGSASPAEVQKLLMAMAPQGRLQTMEAEILLPPTNGPRPKVEGSRHVSQHIFNAAAEGKACGASGPCERLTLLYGQPPGNRVLSIERNAQFAAVPEAVFTKSLIDKYGPPSSRTSDAMVGTQWIWAWDAEGRLLRDLSTTKCRLIQTARIDEGLSSTAKDALAAGCATIVQARFFARNEVVSFITLHALAPAAWKEALASTDAYVSAYARERAQRQRDAAAGNAAPRN